MECLELAAAFDYCTTHKHVNKGELLIKRFYRSHHRKIFLITGHEMIIIDKPEYKPPLNEVVLSRILFTNHIY